jgi:hypothetical protein
MLSQGEKKEKEEEKGILDGKTRLVSGLIPAAGPTGHFFSNTVSQPSSRSSIFEHLFSTEFPKKIGKKNEKSFFFTRVKSRVP